jgi:hypothetical protein
VSHGNAINFINNQFVNSKFTIDSSFNETVSGNYFDTNVAGSALLTITHTASPVSMLRIEDNDFEANGTKSVTSVLFAPAANYETSNVTLTGNIYQGANNVDASGGYGIAFNDPHVRQVYVGAENFRLMYSCIHVTAMLERSTIDRFEARDVVHYGDGFDRYSGPFLRNDFLYKVVVIHLAGYLAAPVTSPTAILADNVIQTGMFHSPNVTLSQRAGQMCSTGWSFSFTNTALESGCFSLIATVGTPVGFGACDFTAIMDAADYIPPR